MCGERCTRGRGATGTGLGGLSGQLCTPRPLSGPRPLALRPWPSISEGVPARWASGLCPSWSLLALSSGSRPFVFQLEQVLSRKLEEVEGEQPSRPAHRPLGPGKGVLCSLSALNRCPQGKSPATRTKSRLNWKTAGPRPRGRWPAWQETVSVPAPPALVATACGLLHSRRRVPARAPGPSIQSTRLCPAGPGLPSPRVLVLRCRRDLLPARR